MVMVMVGFDWLVKSLIRRQDRERDRSTVKALPPEPEPVPTNLPVARVVRWSGRR